MTRELLTRYPRVRSVDPDEARMRVGEVFCPHRLQPLESPIIREIRFNSIQFGAVGLSYLAYGVPVRITPQQLQTFVLVQIPLTGRGLVRTGGDEIVSDADTASVPDPDADLDMRWEGGSEQLIVRVERDILEAQAQRLLGRPLAKPLRMSTAMNLTTPAARSWLGTLTMLQVDLEGPGGLRHPMLQAQTERLVLSQLLASLPSSVTERLTSVTSPGTPKVIRRARQLIDDHCREPLTVEDVAEAVGLSVRSLQQGFRRYLDTTPTSHLREARLAGAHTDLSAADPARATVSQLAADWGFHHLGRFSLIYRQRFGESPSQTLRR